MSSGPFLSQTIPHGIVRFTMRDAKGNVLIDVTGPASTTISDIRPQEAKERPSRRRKKNPHAG